LLFRIFGQYIVCNPYRKEAFFIAFPHRESEKGWRDAGPFFIFWLEKVAGEFCEVGDFVDLCQYYLTAITTPGMIAQVTYGV